MLGFDAVNLYAVLVAAVISFILGSLWYSPLLFGNVWMKLVGVKKPHKKQGMAVKFLVYLLGLAVMAFVLAHFLLFTAATNYVEGLTTAFWLWLGFIAPITIGSVLWEGKSVKLFVLNNAYNLVSLAVMTVILVAWK